MAAEKYPIILREGWFYIAVAIAASLLANEFAGWLVALPLWLLAALLLFLFRDPEREIPASPLAVVSPADGRVVAVQDCADPYLKRDAIRISIHMSVLGIYGTRSPIEGKVRERWHSAAEGIRYGLWIQTDEGDDVVMVMRRRSALNAPRCYVQSGERIGQGQRCGLIRFGSPVDMYLPAACRVAVKEGDRVHAGADVIATLLHK